MLCLSLKLLRSSGTYSVAASHKCFWPERKTHVLALKYKNSNNSYWALFGEKGFRGHRKEKSLHQFRKRSPVICFFQSTAINGERMKASKFKQWEILCCASVWKTGRNKVSEHMELRSRTRNMKHNWRTDNLPESWLQCRNSCQLSFCR